MSDFASSGTSLCTTIYRSCVAPFRRGKRDAARIELGGRRLMLRPRKHIDLISPTDVGEPGVLQHPFPLCIQQSTCYSVTPEVDVGFRILWNLLVHNDISLMCRSLSSRQT